MPSEVCLQVDVGNSSAKWRLMHGAKVLARGCFRAEDEASRAALLSVSPSPERIWVSSVAGAGAEEALEQMLFTQWRVRPWFARTQARSGELVNSYSDPMRMGVDRWLAMLGARIRMEGALCVVDAGSALTIDLVSAEGRHEGGYIIPGAHLMERALLLDTDRVRFAEDIGYELEPGQSTAQAVRHGIAVAQAGAVALVLDRADAHRSLVYCGGGGEKLMALVGRGGECVPDLVFDGLEKLASLEQ